MYTLIHKSHLKNKRILKIARKLLALELEAAMLQEIFFNSNVNRFSKFEKTRGRVRP